MQRTGSGTGILGNPAGPAGNSKLRVVSNLLLVAGALTVALLALVTLVVRQKAVSEAKQSEASFEGAGITIYQVEGDPTWRVGVYPGPTGGMPPDSYTCEFDDGTIVRIRGDKVEAFLSRGYWRDLVGGARLFALIGGMVALAFGAAPRIRGRKRVRVNLESPLGLSADPSSSARNHGPEPEA
jgi:hypothetical protein